MTNVFCINTNLPSVEKLVKEVKSDLDNLLNEKQIALLWNKWVELDNSNVDKLPTSDDIKSTYGKLANAGIEDFRNNETLSEKSEILDVIQYYYFEGLFQATGKPTVSREDVIKYQKEIFEQIPEILKESGMEFVANDFENYRKYFEATRLNKFQIPDVDLEVQEGKQKDTIGENSSIYTDNKENCSDEVVYLIASLTTDETVFGLPKPVNFDQTWNIIQNLLGNSIGDLEFQVDVLQQSNEPFIPQLLQKLGVIDGQISPETKDNTNVRTSFVEAFAKQQQDISITPVGLKNSFSAIDGQEKTSFRDNAKSLFRASKFAHKVNGKTVLNKEEYNKIKFNNTPESLKEFLALFGIDIQGEMTKDIIDNAIVIKDLTNKYLINNELEWLDFQDKALNVSSRVMSIIETQLPYVKKNKNLSVKNAEGKKQSAQSNHNYFSKLFSKLLNKIIKPKSALEKLISNGEVELNLVSGAQTQDRSEAFVFNKLSFTDIVTTTLTNMFSSTPIIQLPRTSDKSSERSMKMLFKDKNANMAYTDISNIVLKNLYDSFQSDLNQTFSDKWKYGAKDSFAFWKQLELEEIKDPSGEKYFETFKIKILEYVENQRNDTVDLFEELGVINLAKKQINFTDSAWSKMSGTFEEKLSKTVDNFNFNSLYFGVLYTQMTQGSMSATTIENMYKRFAGPVAEARTTRADAFKINYLNEGFKKLGLDKFNAKYLKVYVHGETEEESLDKNLIADIYRKNNVDDAQGIMLLPMYKVTLEMTNQWLPKQEELYQKIMKGEKVNEKEFKSTFPPIKPVGQCVIEIDGAKVPIYIKTAVYPISPLDVQGLENEDKYNHGIANGIGLYIPKSGIKMTTPKKLNPIYNKEGKIDEENTTFNFPMEYFGIQLDINPKTSTKQLIGTQIRKLLTTNLFKQGKAADPKYKEWVDKNIKLYEDLSKIETDKLYEAAGIELIKGEPKIINFNKLKELVTDELLSRNMPINVINSLKYIIDTNGNLNGNTIDSLPARQKIMNLLNAIVTNRLIKLNTNGTALVQISQQGWKMKKINKNVEFFKGFWNRAEVAQQTDKIFLFGDNTDDRLNTKYIPSSTQAVIRGLDNAIGIDTKKNRGTGKDSYFTDSDFDVFKKQVDQAINQAKKTGKIIVIPADGIGTGKAMLAEKAPKLFDYLQKELNNLSKVNDSDIIAMKTAIDFVSDDAKLNYYKKGGLQFFTKGKRTGEAEILIPAKYKHYVKPDGTFDETLLVNIGYRIPTQGHNSMLHLKVVGYLPSHLDQVVVMPKEITSQGGSDFDVDKINLFIPNSIILDGKTKFISMDMNPVEIFNDKKAGFEKLITYFNQKIEQYYRKLDKADKKGEDYVSDEVLELLSNNPELYADLEELEIKNIFDSKDFTVEDYEKIYKKLEKFRTKEGKEEWIQNFKSKQLQNEIITQTVEILEDPIVYAALTNPNNSDDLKADAERVNKNLGSKAKKIKLTYNNLFKGITLLKTTYQMFAAKALVGVFASQSTHHALSQQVGLHFKSGRKFFFDHNTVEVDGELRISLSNDKSQEYVDLVESEKQGKIVMKRYEISDALGNNKLTAAVDAAKDDYLTSLGINLQTGDVFALGDRVGANPYYMTAWINQPIIQDYLNLTKKANSMTAKSGGNDMNKRKIIHEILVKYKTGVENYEGISQYIAEKYVETNDKSFSKKAYDKRQEAGNYTVEQLEDSWFNNKGTKEMALHLLDDFLYFEDAAAILRQSISTSKFDTAGPGKDVLESLLLSMKYQKFVEDMNGKSGYTLATIENNNKKINLIYNNKKELENLKKEFSSFSNLKEKFKGDLEDTKNLIDVFTQVGADANFYKPFSTDISTQRKKDIISGKSTTYIWEDNFNEYRKNIEDSLKKELELEDDRFNYWFENDTTFYYFDVESKNYYKYNNNQPKYSQNKEYEITRNEYYNNLDIYKEKLKEENLQEQENIKENVLRQPFLEGKIVRLFDNHFVIVTNHTIKEEGDSFINEIEFIYYDKFDYDRLRQLEKDVNLNNQNISVENKQAPYANIINNTLLKVFYDKSFNFVGSIYHDLVALHKNTYIEEAVKGLIYPTTANFVTKPVDSQEASKIYGAVINYLIQSQIPLNHSLVYGDNTVHHRIIKIQENPNHPLHNNDVIQSFFNVELSGNDGIPSVSAPKSKSITTDEAGAFTRGFEEIQFLEPELYNDLVTIAMYQTGVLQSPTSFYNYLPVQTVIPLVSKAIKDAIPTNSKKIARAVIANIGNKMDNIQRVTAKEGDKLVNGRLTLIDPEKAKGKVFIKYAQYIGNESITKLYEYVGPYFQEIEPKNHKQLFYDLRDNAELIEAVGVIDEEIPFDNEAVVEEEVTEPIVEETIPKTAWDNLTTEQQEQLKDKVLPEYFNTWSKEKQEAFLECNTK